MRLRVDCDAVGCTSEAVANRDHCQEHEWLAKGSRDPYAIHTSASPEHAPLRQETLVENAEASHPFGTNTEDQ
jgi:hypothetical protein